MEKRKIILDCDPGHDDAIAIMMAAKHPAIDLLGITIVAGNQTLDKTLINGLNVCQKLEINVPVYAGMPQPIMRQQIVADNIHGETGLDGPVFEPLTRQAESTHAVKYIIDTLMASDGDITLVPVGPLSNIAVAMRMQPAILPKISFALCGFANFGSIGVVVGAFSAVAPHRAPEIAQLGLRALAAATLSNLMSATIAGFFIGLA